VLFGYFVDRRCRSVRYDPPNHTKLHQRLNVLGDSASWRLKRTRVFQ